VVSSSAPAVEQRFLAVASEQFVVAGTAIQDIVVLVAEDLVGSIAAHDDVVAFPAMQGVVAFVAEDHVVALVAGDLVVTAKPDQEVVARPPFEDVGLVGADQGVVLVVAAQIVAALAADDVLDRSEDVAGRGAAVALPEQEIDRNAVDFVRVGHHVLAAAAVEHVGARAAVQVVVSVESGNDVVAGGAEQLVAVRRARDPLARRDVAATGRTEPGEIERAVVIRGDEGEVQAVAARREVVDDRHRAADRVDHQIVLQRGEM
jgi:hypothetical protein